MMRLRSALLLCVLVLGPAVSADAQSWPARPIKIIVPTGPGAATDVMARLMADAVTRGLGQPVVVENNASASGLGAHQTAARAAPDGYTFLFTNTSGLATNLVTFKSIPYDPVKDFTPVAMVVDFGPQMLSVNVDVPVTTVAGLIDYAKTNPGKLSYAVDVTAGAAPFAARLLNKRANLGMVEVPYRSAAQMANDVASGVIPVLISSMAASNAMVQAGKIRRIALSSSNRFPPLPELPTISETVPGVTMDGWFVLVAPGSLHERVRRLLPALLVATTTVALTLDGQGALPLGTHVAEVLSDWTGTDRAPVTIRHLLEHASGLSARLLDTPPYDRRTFMHEICAMPLEYEPGSRAVYSDLGFILLGFCCEERGGGSLANQVQALLDPLSDGEVEHRLLTSVDAGDRGRTAPTAPLAEDERRGRMLVGEVHDNYAAALGGFAGHAGLFGTAPAVGRFARRLLRAARGVDEAPLPFSATTVKRSTTLSTTPQVTGLMNPSGGGGE